MASERFLNFDVLLDRAGDGYRVRLLDSPAGQAEATVAAGALALPDIGPAAVAVGRRELLPADGVQPMVAAGVPGGAAARALGGRLFEVLFGGDLRVALAASLAAAEGEGAGLRVRLRTDDAPELGALPWEYAFDAERARFVVLAGDVSLVRFVPLPERARPVARRGPLRILVLLASPPGLAALDLGAEWDRLQTVLAPLVADGRVALSRPAAGTLPALQATLGAGQHDVLHYAGHGGLEGGDGVLMLEDEGGQLARPVSGNDLGMLLRGHDALRLVVLNACEGARVDPAGAAGAGYGLVAQGIPGVIAMQHPVSDPAAIAFAGALYRGLCDGRTIDGALGAARQAVFASRAADEWGTAALFLRDADGTLWPEGDDDATESPATEAPWWADLPSGTGGDVIVAEIGAGASGVAVGKGIVQTIVQRLGPPRADDAAALSAALEAVTAAVRSAGGLAPGTAEMAELQLGLLAAELGKTADDPAPSAATITRVGDGLLDAFPAAGESLRQLFATPAAGRALARAGGPAVEWARARFGDG